MPTQLASAYVQIIPSAQGISGKISEALGGEAESAGYEAGKISGASFVSTMAKAVAAAGLGKMLMEAINIGGELEQNLGGTEAVFQEYASTIQTYAQDAYKNMGMSASDYMATANKMASLFQGSGMDIQTSMDLTTEAMQRAADVASVMGIDTEWAMESIAGAAKGNFEMMDNLGVAMNATTLQAYALEKGINFEWNTATNAEKSTLAMEMFMERTENMAGNFARESADTISGSMGAMKSAFTDFVGNLTLGKDIQGPLKALLEQTKIFLIDNLLPAVGNIIGTLPSVIGQVFTIMGPQLMSSGLNLINSISQGLVTGVPTFLNNVLPMLTQFTGKMRENVGLIVNAGMELLKNLAQGIVNAMPTLIAEVPKIVDNIAMTINENFPKILTTAGQIIYTLGVGLINNIPNLLANIGSILTAIWHTMMAFDWMNLAGNLIKLLADGVGSFAEWLITAFYDLGVSAVDTVLSIDWFQLGADIINGVVDGIKSLFDWAMSQIGSFFGGIVDGVKNFLGIASPSKVFAEFGEMVDRGFAKGVLDHENVIRKATEDAAALATTTFDQHMIYDMMPRMYDTGSDDKKSKSDGGFTQNITINAPKQLDPSETARLTRNQTRQTILALKGV